MEELETDRNQNSGVADAGDDDARTLHVLYDNHGDGYREWREGVRESTTEHYPQYLIDGLLSCLSLCTHFERHGGSPRIWLDACSSPLRRTPTLRSRTWTRHDIFAHSNFLYQCEHCFVQFKKYTEEEIAAEHSAHGRAPFHVDCSGYDR